MSQIHGKYSTRGFYPTGFSNPGVWLRDKATIRFLHHEPIHSIAISGTRLEPDPPLHSRLSRGDLALSCRIDGSAVGRETIGSSGDYRIRWDRGNHEPTAASGERTLSIHLEGVGFTNFLALLGRLMEKQIWLPKSLREWLQPFRRQGRNRQLLIRSLSVNDEVMLDFDRPHSTFVPAFVVEHSRLGVNVLGWFHGFLGVGESARACVRAAEAAGLQWEAVNLKLNLEGHQSKSLWTRSLKEKGKQGITIAHVDAPQSDDLVRLHPDEMSKDRYRIGYWAWELPEFPDHWIQFASQYDEIWCPSEFCRQAMAPKLPVPVLVMPHAIPLAPETADQQVWRERFGLPPEAYLFLFSFDFNSYAPRKNPEAVIEAFRIACARMGGPPGSEVGLVLKMHGKGYDAADRARLDAYRESLPGLQIIDQTLDRDALTGLQQACDSFVSLHRSEGFGLAPAEMMALGKPVIATDWSATSEFVNSRNGCPVQYEQVTLDRNIGPYTKGQQWAEASVEDAAKWMQRLVENPDMGKRLGKQAREDIRTHYSAEAIGQRYLSRLKSIALFRKT